MSVKLKGFEADAGDWQDDQHLVFIVTPLKMRSQACPNVSKQMQETGKTINTLS